VSPILVRPVREQFEHDRIIRVLQARYKRKYEVIVNPGAEQNASIIVGELAMYPDLVLFNPERGRKLQATVEVETTESINTLEAMAEWGPFSRLRAAFYLYVPASSIDTVRRLCTELTILPAELWTYHSALDQVRFTMVHRIPDSPRAEGRVPRVEVRTPRLEPRPEQAGQPSPSGQPAAEPRAAESRGFTRHPDARSARLADGRPSRDAERPPRVAEARPGHTAKPRAAGSARSEKAKPAKKAAPVRAGKTAKKAAGGKKPPRATAARARKVAQKPARKSAAKRSASPKR
jgi:hypothetical protein